MSLMGWDGNLADGARICTTPPSDAHKHRVGNNGRDQVAAVGMRKGLWKRYGMALYPALAKVALRLLSIHPTSAATERNWSLWGRVYTAARNTLGLERAKALIMFCFNDRCQRTDQQDFKLLLSVVEGEFAEEQEHFSHVEVVGQDDIDGNHAPADSDSDDDGKQ
jgi:hypothetical protein